MKWITTSTSERQSVGTAWSRAGIACSATSLRRACAYLNSIAATGGRANVPAQHTPPPPKQAVILAGGRGTRLGALTADRPKPMIEFQGKPFLAYLVEQLRDEGFQRVLMLLGYLPEVVQDYFRNGERWGIAIEYSVTGPDDLTVHRLRTAAPLLDEQFLLAYCDNYWPLQIDKLWRRFVESGREALVTVYANRDGYTKDCVLVDDEQLVRVYDRSRSAPDLQGVEIGYAIINRS